MMNNNRSKGGLLVLRDGLMNMQKVRLLGETKQIKAINKIDSIYQMETRSPVPQSKTLSYM